MLVKRKTLRFPRSFLCQNVTHRMKYRDFYHKIHTLTLLKYELFFFKIGQQLIG